MEKLIAVCGLDCSSCEAFITTKTNDMEKRNELAEKWSKEYKVSILPENINCEGCRIDGKHIGYCSICEVRKCGISKNIESCALCKDYPDCSILNAFLKMAPEEGTKKIKNNLENIYRNR